MPYRGLLCYAAEEASFLHQEGFDDLMVAYPTFQSSDLATLRDLHERGASVKAVVDSLEGLRALNEAMRGIASPFPAVLDVDVSLRLFAGALHLGVRRSPVRSWREALVLFDAARELPAVQLIGVMAYEAQVAGLGDHNPFRRLTNPVARLVRRRSVRTVAQARSRLAQALAAAGYRLDLFNGGGTGSLSWAATEPWLTELSAGSGLLAPHLFDYYSNLQLEPAAFFALQAVRSSDPGYLTSQGGGYIASGEPGWDKVPLPYMPPGLQLVSTEGCGEVQTPLRLGHGTRIPPGAPVLFRHAKAGELAEHFTEYLLVSRGAIVSRVRTYRGLGQCFF